MGAFEADGCGGLGHVPTIFLEFPENKFTFVGAAGFVQGAVGLLSAFDHAAKKFWRKMVRLDTHLRADDDQTLDEVAEFANVAGPGVAKKNFQGAVGEFASFFSVGGTEFIQEMTSEDWNVGGAVAQPFLPGSAPIDAGCRRWFPWSKPP